MNINTVGFVSFVALVATLVFTVLAYKFVIPEKKRAGLNKLGQFLNDVFNFRFLIVEKILQFFYVLSTIACICGGICMIFGITIYKSSWSGDTYTQWYGIYGILLALLGPIVLRISFEGLMMFLLLVKNVIQINKKLKGENDAEEYQMPSFKELISKDNFAFLKNQKAAPSDAAEENHE